MHWNTPLRVCALLGFAACAFPQRVITTIAGTDWLFPGDGQPALNAPLSGAFGLDLAIDRNGNYFIADDENLMVMRVGPDGIINVIAGNGFGFFSGDGGLAVNAGLFQPGAVTVDSAGNVYIAEYGGDIRRVTPDGIITTIAGAGRRGFGGDNGPAINALLDGPYGLAVDSAFNLYISDTHNNRIRKVTSSGIISTIGGTGQQGFGGDGGRAIDAQLNGPSRLALDGAGNIYFVDAGNFRVRKIDANGIITTVAGGGTNFGDGTPAVNAGLIPLAMALDCAGALYLADALTYGILKIDAQGKIVTIAGGSGKPGFDGDGGNALSAHFQFQYYPALAIDSAGNILFADEVNERVRKITPDGKVNSVAGNGRFHFSGDGGPATSASLDLPTSVVADSSGNVFLTEPGLNHIRRVAPDGTISVYAGTGMEGYSGDGGPASSAALAFPNYLAFGPNGSLFFTDTFNCVVRYITTSGIIGTFAGSGSCADAGDNGPALQASFIALEGLDFDGAGDLIVSEGFHHRLRVVLANGTVATLAGNGTAGFSGDGGVSTKALVNNPVGVRVHNGFIYFCDSLNHRIRRIEISTLTISTVAGNGRAGYLGDGGPATQASLNEPQSIAFDSAGNMYIADLLNQLIRKVTPDGTISTFAGSRTEFALNDGRLATDAALGATGDLFVDSKGNVLMTDFFYNRVRAVLNNVPSYQANPTALAFTAPAGSSAVDQSVDIVGSIPGIPFTASASSNGDWLQLSSASGVMPASLRVTADPSALSAGNNQGTITISSPVANPSSLTIRVALTTTARSA